MTSFLALPEGVTNPFVGLRPFESDEALLFFGRREQTIELLSRLHGPRFLAVVGSSGCGKSSLIRAGMIPMLRAGLHVDERDRWFVAAMKPGDRPRRNLSTALLTAMSKQKSGPNEEELARALLENGITAVVDTFRDSLNRANANLLLLVDQFEEIFRFGVNTNKSERKAEAADFVSLILALAAQREIPIYVVMTMRSDFLGTCDAFYGLPEAVNNSQYLVPRLNRNQLRTVIEGPVKLGGRSIAPRLVDRLLNDIRNASDELPLLQHALMKIWEEPGPPGDDQLDLTHYRSIGKLDDALSRHAEQALTSLDETLVGRMFRALTHTDESNRRIRRGVQLKDLEAEIDATREELVPIVEAFRRQDRSFLMPPPCVVLQTDTLIDISHESLIRQWRRLQLWVDQEAENKRQYERYAEAADRHAKKTGSLLAGLDLTQALQWRQKTHHNETWARRYGGRYRHTMSFLDKSDEQQQARKHFLYESHEQQQARERYAKQLQDVTELTVIADLKPGFINVREPTTYATRLRMLLPILNAIGSSQTGSPEGSIFVGPIEQLHTIHHVRWTIFDNERKLLWTVVFNGSFETYIRRLVDQAGPVLDVILCHCQDYEGYKGYDAFIDFVRKNQL